MSDEYESDELQNVDDEQIQDDDVEESEDLDEQEDLESAPDSEPEHEENAEGGSKRKPVNQEKVDQAIARQHAKYREEQRRSQALERELEEMRRSSGQTRDPEPKIVQVDPYDDNVEEQIRKRDQSVREHMAWQQRQREEQYRQEHQSRQVQAQNQQMAQEVEKRFMDAAKSLKVDNQELDNAIRTVGQYQLGQDVAQYLMDDDKGVQMTIALAKDPVLMSELADMPVYERFKHLERNVRSKINTDPRRSKGKQPPTRVKGRASDVSDRYPLTGGRVKVE